MKAKQVEMIISVSNWNGMTAKKVRRIERNVKRIARQLNQHSVTICVKAN